MDPRAALSPTLPRKPTSRHAGAKAGSAEHPSNFSWIRDTVPSKELRGGNDTMHSQPLVHGLIAFVVCCAPAFVTTTFAQACVGDCNGDGRVTVDEVVRGVTIALGQGSVQACPNLDVDGNAQITVDELLLAVHVVLDGCVAAPTATATETPRPLCTPPLCQSGEVFFCSENCPGGCGTICVTPTPTRPTATLTPSPSPTNTVTCAPTGTPYVGNCPECGSIPCFLCEMVRENCPAHPCGPCINATPTPSAVP